MMKKAYVWHYTFLYGWPSEGTLSSAPWLLLVNVFEFSAPIYIRDLKFDIELIRISCMCDLYFFDSQK
jgi:hypothetical protein